MGTPSLAAKLLFLITPTLVSATLTHDYQFQGNLNDSLGGPSLTSLGGTVNSSNYTFGAGQGLSLENAFSNPSNYSVVMQFSFATVGGYRKVLDFKNRAEDTGLYVYSSDLRFYNVSVGSGAPFVTNGTSVVVLTRDGSTNTVVGYVDGTQYIQFVDSTSLSVFSATNGIAHFFVDDSGSENSAGFVNRIQIFDGSLSANEVQNLNFSGAPQSGVPEPGTMGLMSLGLVALGWGVRRRRG